MGTTGLEGQEEGVVDRIPAAGETTRQGPSGENQPATSQISASATFPSPAALPTGQTHLEAEGQEAG